MPIPLATLFQDSAPTQAPPPPVPSIFSSQLFPLLIIAVLFFVLLILPERKKQKERQKMLDALKKGDRVLTTSGIYGTVVTTTAEVVVVQVADNVRLRFSRAAVQSVIEAAKEPVIEEKAEPTKV